MNFALSEEQVMLRDAARDALSRLNTVASARGALDGAELVDVWPTAREAGWTGMLVAEERGGAGLAPFDAMLVSEECGRRLTGAGVLGHLMATHLIERGVDVAADVAGQLADGALRAACVVARPPRQGEAWTVDAPGGQRAPCPEARVGQDGRSATVSGRASFVLDLPGADVIVVVAVTAEGEPVAVLLEAGAAGVAVEPVVRYDASRPLGHLTLTEATGQVVAAGAGAAEDAWLLGQALLAADALGVCQAVSDMALAYAMERYTFGRPIGSYQAIKHQLTEIVRHIDNTRNLCFYTGFAAEAQPEELALAASSARFAGERAADYATRTCLAIHGGIGATWEHDAPFYWRRAQLSRLLLGGMKDAGDRVAAEIIVKAGAADAPAPMAA